MVKFNGTLTAILLCSKEHKVPTKLLEVINFKLSSDCLVAFGFSSEMWPLVILFFGWYICPLVVTLAVGF